MGLLDDFFEAKMYEKKDSELKYTPMKFSTGNKMRKATKQTEKKESAIKKCATWVYINGVDWCIAFKGTHIHKKCMNEIFDMLPERKGIPYSEFIQSLTPTWTDYWYDSKNYRHYTKQQLKRVEREMDRGRDSEELVMEMLMYVFFNMIDERDLYEEIDDKGIYKLNVKWVAK